MNELEPNARAPEELKQQRKAKRKAKRQTQGNAMRQYVKDEVTNAKQGLAKLGPKEIFDLYNKKDGLVLGALQRLESKVAGLTQNQIARFAMDKFGKNSVKELRAFAESQGVNIKGVSNKLLEDLLALDDWSAIWAVAKPLFIKYGVPVLKDLWSRYVAPKLGLGGDEGFNSSDWAGNTTNPYRYSFNPGLNVSMKGVSSAMEYSGIHDLVSTTSIKAIIAPELFKYRYSYTESQRTALAVPSAEYSIVSNASGQVGIGLFVRNVVTTGATYVQSYLSIYNDATFSVATGTQTPACAFNAGPLYSSLSNFDSYRHNVTAVTFLPTASLNTAGAFTFGYNNRFGSQNNSSTNIGITLPQLKTWPYVTSFNNKTSARFTSVYGDSPDDSFTNGNAAAYHQTHYMVLLGSGLPASTEVGRLLIQSLVEFQPTLAAFPICPVDFPQTGPLTEQFESLMYQRWPAIQMLDLQDAKRVADALPSLPVKYSELFSMLEPLMGGIQPREYVSHSVPLNHVDAVNSFDFQVD